MCIRPVAHSCRNRGALRITAMSSRLIAPRKLQIVWHTKCLQTALEAALSARAGDSFRHRNDDRVDDFQSRTLANKSATERSAERAA